MFDNILSEGGMDEKQARAAYEVEIAERGVRDMMARRDERRMRLAKAERAVEYALNELREKRKAFDNIKSE